MADTAPTSGNNVFERFLQSVRLGILRIPMYLHGFRYSRTGGPVSVIRKKAMIGVVDNDYELMLPTPRRVIRYRGGIAWRIAKLAGRYGCPDFYEPQARHVVVDVGSNVGEFSLYAVRKGADVYAFEPDPTVFACLAHNLRDLSNAHIFQLALWNEHTTLRFFKASEKADSSFFEPDSHVQGVIELEAWRLDDVAEIAALNRIDFLKIDGEGAEPEILQGAEKTLQRTDRIAIDVGPERQGESTRDAVIEILEASGFTILDHDSDCELMAENRSIEQSD
ncbi:MAG: FkbM family methyltransferase [Desulfobulbaceae bacterium]|nr:MAG: FkbM family methyltransferase [Desulfobulbaceae bacterium]